MNGFVFTSLSSVGDSCLKQYLSDLGKKSLAKMWKGSKLSDFPFSVRVVPANKYYALAFGMSDKELVLGSIVKMFDEQFSAVRDRDFVVEVFER